MYKNVLQYPSVSIPSGGTAGPPLKQVNVEQFESHTPAADQKVYKKNVWAAHIKTYSISRIDQTKKTLYRENVDWVPQLFFPCLLLLAILSLTTLPWGHSCLRWGTGIDTNTCARNKGATSTQLHGLWVVILKWMGREWCTLDNTTSWLFKKNCTQVCSAKNK